VVALALCAALVGAPASLGQGHADSPQAAADLERGVLPTQKDAELTWRLKGVRNGGVKVGKRLIGIGTVRPFVPGQHVRAFVKQGDRVVKRVNLRIERVAGSNAGTFRIRSSKLVEPAKYRAGAVKVETPEQEGFSGTSRAVEVDYPDLDPGDHGQEVKLFNKLLAKKAYFTAKSGSYGSATGRAVLAFRKVNNMARTTNANPGIFRQLAAGKGGFKLKWPGGGKHVEADLSRQVMVLAKRGKPQHIFHISSGTGATPTVRGKFPTYRKDFGTNSKGMVHSVYFIRGYATHGYPSVPTYPASHGCLRNPIPNALFIYKWIDFGDVFYVYG
jgi:hypothetical protein